MKVEVLTTAPGSVWYTWLFSQHSGSFYCMCSFTCSHEIQHELRSQPSSSSASLKKFSSSWRAGTEKTLMLHVLWLHPRWSMQQRLTQVVKFTMLMQVLSAGNDLKSTNQQLHEQNLSAGFRSTCRAAAAPNRAPTSPSTSAPASKVLPAWCAAPCCRRAGPKRRRCSSCPTSAAPPSRPSSWCTKMPSRSVS